MYPITSHFSFFYSSIDSIFWQEHLQGEGFIFALCSGHSALWQGSQSIGSWKHPVLFLIRNQDKVCACQWSAQFLHLYSSGSQEGNVPTIVNEPSHNTIPHKHVPISQAILDSKKLKINRNHYSCCTNIIPFLFHLRASLIHTSISFKSNEDVTGIHCSQIKFLEKLPSIWQIFKPLLCELITKYWPR